MAAQDVEQVFKVMGEILKSPHQTSQTQSQSQTNTHWTGLVSHHQNIQPNINVSTLYIISYQMLSYHTKCYHTKRFYSI